jgi:hypothetical protein
MEFALTQEVSEAIINNGVSGHIHDVSTHISKFLRARDYGSDLSTLYIGIICVGPEFEFFFKVRKPKYKKGKVVTIEDGRPYEATDALVYDIKLNYNNYLIASQKEVIKMLSVELRNSFVVFNSISIKVFDREKFERDVAFCFSQLID